MRLYKAGLFLAFSFSFLAPITPNAQSLDVNELMRTFQNEMAAVEGTLTFSNAKINSDGDVTIEGFDLFIGSAKQRIMLDELTIENVRRNTEGLIRYDGYSAKGTRQTFNNPNGTKGSIVSDEIIADSVSITTKNTSQNPLWNYAVEQIEYKNAKFELELPDSEAIFDVPSMTFTGFSQSGVQNTTLSGAAVNKLNGTVTFEKGKSKFPLNVDGLSFSNLKQIGANGFEIGTIKWGKTKGEFPNQNGKTELFFDGFEASNIYSPDFSDPAAKLLSDKRAEVAIGAMQVLVNGANVFSWDAGSGFNEFNKDTGIAEGSGGIEKIMIDFSALPMPPNGQSNLEALHELGYEQLTINILAGGKWDLDTGTIEVTDYDIEVENAGTVRLDAKVTGYTEDVARNIQKLANEVNTETDPQAQQIKSMQILAALTNLSIQELALNVQDQSLLNKVIGYQASQLNQEPEQITQIVGPMAQVVLAPYNVPEFAAAVSQALNTFMQGNKSITVTAEPEGGLVMTEIIALSSALQAGQITPAEIIQRLNLKVTSE